jgi:TonB family protein
MPAQFGSLGLLAREVNMPDPEVNADILKTRLASFARVSVNEHTARTCPQCGKEVDTDGQTCQSCGASCNPPVNGDYRVATAAPELTASRKVYDPYEHMPLNAVSAATDSRTEEEPTYSAPLQDAGDEEEEDEPEADRRNYLRAVMFGLLVGVLGLAAMSIWHWRGRIRDAGFTFSRELSSELEGLRDGVKPAPSKQSSVQQNSAPRKQPGNQRLYGKHSARPSVTPSDSAIHETAGNVSPKLAITSDSGVPSGELKPALMAAAVSPMRISVAPRESLQLLISSVPPIYPRQARERRIEGSVALKAVIGRDGTISEIRLVSGDPQLVPAAMDAVTQWRYRPYFLYGEAHEVETTILVDFSLAKE